MVSRIWDQFEDYLIAILAGTALMLVCYDVMARYFAPQHLTDWGGEVVIYLMIWATLLAGSALVRDGRHINADLVVRILPERVQSVLTLIGVLAGGFSCGLVAWFGADVVAFAARLDIRGDSSIQFPIWIFYAALPASFALMAFRYAVRCIAMLRGADIPAAGHGRRAVPASAVDG